jgi:hypothetical protein
MGAAGVQADTAAIVCSCGAFAGSGFALEIIGLVDDGLGGGGALAGARLPPCERWLRHRSRAPLASERLSVLVTAGQCMIAYWMTVSQWLCAQRPRRAVYPSSDR